MLHCDDFFHLPSFVCIYSLKYWPRLLCAGDECVQYWVPCAFVISPYWRGVLTYYFVNGITNLVLILLFFLFKIDGKLHEINGVPSVAQILNYFHWIFDCYGMEEGKTLEVFIWDIYHIPIYELKFPQVHLFYIRDYYYVINLFKWW